MAKAIDLGVDDVYACLTELFGLTGEVRKGEFRMLCPIHVDTHPSCDVELKTGYWNCFSCKGAGDLIDLGFAVLQRPRREIKKLLQPNDPDARLVSIQRRLRARRNDFEDREVHKEPSFVPEVPEVDSYRDGPLDAMKERGFNDRTLRFFGIRYVKKAILLREDDEPFTIDHAIGIPIVSEDGKCMAWCYRATERSKSWFQNARYIYTPGVTDTLNEMWFGMDKFGDNDEITITEGALDAMWCFQHDIPALAILGSNAKQGTKIRKLMRYRRVTLLTDRDRAGVDAALALGESLQERGVPVMVSRYSSWMLNRKGERAKDPQDLCGVDLELVHTRAIPFALWKRAAA